jgi:hypothetical protein
VAWLEVECIVPEIAYLAPIVFGVVAIGLLLIVRYDFQGWTESSVFRLIAFMFGIAMLVGATMMLARAL